MGGELKDAGFLPPISQEVLTTNPFTPCAHTLLLRGPFLPLCWSSPLSLETGSSLSRAKRKPWLSPVLLSSLASLSFHI